LCFAANFVVDSCFAKDTNFIMETHFVMEKCFANMEFVVLRNFVKDTNFAEFIKNFKGTHFAKFTWIVVEKHFITFTEMVKIKHFIVMSKYFARFAKDIGYRITVDWLNDCRKYFIMAFDIGLWYSKIIMVTLRAIKMIDPNTILHHYSN